MSEAKLHYVADIGRDFFTLDTSFTPQDQPCEVCAGMGMPFRGCIGQVSLTRGSLMGRLTQ